LRAVFGEIYPDPVRVISVGVPVEQLIQDPLNVDYQNTSVELCGGSHLSNSNQAQLFVLLSDEGIAKGVRRIVGCTGTKAFSCQELAKTLKMEVQQVKLPGTSMAELEALMRKVQSSMVSKSVKLELDVALSLLHKQLSDVNKGEDKKVVQDICTTLLDMPFDLLVSDLGQLDVKLVEQVAKELLKRRGKEEMGFFLFCKQDKDMFASCVCVSDAMLGKKFKADEWMQSLAPEFGKGGGKPNKASLRGDLNKLELAMDKAMQVACTHASVLGKNVVMKRF
jgi:alanyl-tRNA synthetase